MKNIDDLLDAVRKSSDWDTDYKIGRGLGYTNSTQVSGWRRRVAMPNIEDIAALADHANLNLEEAIRAVIYSRKNERPIKQAGFGNVAFLSTIALGSYGAMTLSKMSALPYDTIGASFGLLGVCILC